MSTSLVFSGAGMNDRVVVGGALPAIYGIHGEAKVDRVEVTRKRNSFSFTNPGKQNLSLDQEESSESSSIGVASSSSSDKEDGEDGEEEVQSKKNEGAFGSLETLEESLPMKRGLSNFFAGKSKSFAALSDLSNASSRDLAKPENPFNKRRRILMASKFRRASYGSLLSAASSNSTFSSSSSLSLFSADHTVDEEEEEEEEEEAEVAAAEKLQRQKPNLRGTITVSPLITGCHGGCDERLEMMGLMKPAFRSPRSFSLSDLQQA